MPERRPPEPDGRGENSYHFDFHEDEIEFIKAIERYRKEKKKRHLAWHEVLEVVKRIGYTKDKV
jgi:hypothetical protein